MNDDEWNFPEVQALNTADYSLTNYNALLLVLDSRETVSAIRDRLRFGFLAHGLQIGASSPANSQIYIGDVL